METGEIAVLTALWLGLLTSISPCPLATNIAAVSYVGKQVGRPSQVILAGVLYTLGRMLTYLVLGAAAVWSLLSVVAVSNFLQTTMQKALGPILIVVGIALLGILRFGIAGPGVSESFKRRVDRWGLWGALPLGLVFALSFCPLAAAMFFGSLIPLATQHQSPIVLPALYGLGTGVPVWVFAGLLAYGVSWLGKAFDRVAVFERWARRVTGVVFIVVGIYETMRSFGVL